jgi:hypothetical protein
MLPKRVALGQEAIEKLKIAQSCLAEAYGVLVKSGLSHRNAKSICKNYIDDSFNVKSRIEAEVN